MVLPGGEADRGALRSERGRAAAGRARLHDAAARPRSRDRGARGRGALGVDLRARDRLHGQAGGRGCRRRAAHRAGRHPACAEPARELSGTDAAVCYTDRLAGDRRTHSRPAIACGLEISSSNFPKFNRNLNVGGAFHLATAGRAGATDRPARWRHGVATAVAGVAAITCWPPGGLAARRAPRGTARDQVSSGFTNACSRCGSRVPIASRRRRCARVSSAFVSAPRSPSPASCWPTASRRAFRGS